MEQFGLSICDVSPNCPTVLGGIAVVASVVPIVGDGVAKVLRGADKVADAARAGEKAAARAADAAKTCCFAAGTLVMTEEGLRPIESIAVGDKVLARDETTGETGYKPVTQLIRRHDRTIWNLTLASTGDDGKTITTVFETTDDHPWRSVVGTWLKTMELKPGMEILRARGPPAKVVSIENTGKTRATFNLEVADYHSYFVGEPRAWVHNACPVGNDGIGPKHGASDHNDAIDTKVKELEGTGAKDIRKNQQQVDAKGNKVGTNRPDLQWTDKKGQRNAMEWGRSDDRLRAQAKTIKNNDPKCNVKTCNIGH